MMAEQNFLDRLIAEANELILKVTALGLFINSDKYFNVSNFQQDLIGKQFKAMTQYLGYLQDRIEDLQGVQKQ